eukprot:scaffold16107_cov67-Phaeocystis_antarctica.AAC.7
MTSRKSLAATPGAASMATLKLSSSSTRLLGGPSRVVAPGGPGGCGWGGRRAWSSRPGSRWRRPSPWQKAGRGRRGMASAGRASARLCSGRRPRRCPAAAVGVDRRARPQSCTRVARWTCPYDPRPQQRRKSRCPNLVEGADALRPPPCARRAQTFDSCARRV